MKRFFPRFQKYFCFCRIPPPKVESHLPFCAHIFDSWYETHRGPVVCIAVHDGAVSKGQRIRTYHGDCEYEVLMVGIMSPNMLEVDVSSSVLSLSDFSLYLLQFLF